jgi:hypothetical protein
MKHKFLYWAPRILCMLAIAFVMMFSFDVFSIEASFGEQMMGFLIHNIPAFVLMILLIVAWKWELAGGIIFTSVSVAGLFFTTHFFKNNYGSIVVVVPFLLTGILFILHYRKEKKDRDITKG